jgi:hypothetical protein
MSKSTKSSKIHHGRTVAHHESRDGPLDIIAAKDTRYPDIHSKRRFTGNGKTPGNPFGHSIPTPKEK